jgi:adenosylcobinamide-phosphate synthase
MLWLVALGWDLRWGEPPVLLHPVVWMGRAIAALEARAPQGALRELCYGGALVGAPALAAALLGVAARATPRPLRWALTVWLIKSTFALRALVDAGDAVEDALVRDDVVGARMALRSLVSRDVPQLDRAHLASAAVESLAENLADSYIAPLLFYCIGGLPAALAYRAVNTADAMVGYRGRYQWLGKLAARSDDVLNLLPARASALAIVIAAQLRGAGQAALRVLVRDHRRTESPNAGWPMSAAAGALGVWLEKPGHYRLGDGRAPEAETIRDARSLVLLAAALATIACLGWRR